MDRGKKIKPDTESATLTRQSSRIATLVAFRRIAVLSQAVTKPSDLIVTLIGVSLATESWQ